MMKKTNNYNYNDKIRTIESYFGISNNASKYMFHRRRRGIPWKTDDDASYLKWTIQLQNALIKADNILEFDWVNLRFNTDIQTLLENGIVVNNQSCEVQANKQTPCSYNSNGDDDGGGWTVVTKNKTRLIQKHLLKQMGFLPKTKKTFKN
jgi:hypothetical protein